MKNNKDTIVVYTYRYMWKTEYGDLCVRYVTEPQEGHIKFQTALRDDPSIVSAMREYVSEVNFAFLGFTEPVKEEKKEEKENEKI